MPRIVPWYILEASLSMLMMSKEPLELTGLSGAIIHPLLKIVC